MSGVIFVAVQSLPGDAAARILGREASQAAKDRLRAEMNLEADLPQR
ncbi:MAG: hypothetical protein ACT4OK_06380 [Gemmobacter sp.]